MKKRVLCGLALSFLLTFLAATALTADRDALHDYFAAFAKLESEHGSYRKDWEPGVRTQLVQWMQLHGLRTDGELTQTFHQASDEAERDSIAEEIIELYYGAPDYLYLEIVIGREAGPEGDLIWSQADSAQLAALTEAYDRDDLTPLMIPGKEDATLSVALDTARKAIAEKDPEYVDADFFESCITEHYFTKQAPYDEPVWYIQFHQDPPGDGFDFQTYSITLSRKGELLEASTPSLGNPLNERFDALLTERGPFVQWSLADKAIFAGEWPALIAEADKHSAAESTRGWIRYLAGKPFALPDETAIKEDAALRIATDALSASDMLQEPIEDFRVCTSFLKPEEGKAIWRFTFIPTTERTDPTDRGFQVDLEAQTGKVMEIRHQKTTENQWAMYYE